MKRRHKGIQDFLFLTIILFLMVLPAFHECHDLMDLEIFSPPPHFEQAHPEEMASSRQDSWQGLELHASVLALLLEANFFQQSFNGAPSTFSNNQRCPILRC